MAKPFGKNINLEKKKKERPGNNYLAPKKQHTLTQLNNTRKKTQYRWDGNRNPSTTGYMGGDTNAGASPIKRGWSAKYSPGYTNPFYLFLCDNAIAETSIKIKPGTHDVIYIANPTGHLGIDLLRRGDYFWIYNTITYKSVRIMCSVDLMDSGTLIKITPTVFKFSDNFPSGSLIVPDYKVQTQRLSNVPLLKRYEITTAEYQALNSNPYTLLAGSAGILHIPLSCTIVVNIVGNPEITAYGMYVGWLRSFRPGHYWSSIDRFAYRARDNQLYQVNGDAFAASGPPAGVEIPLKSPINTTLGMPLELYADPSNPTGDIHLTVFLYYKSVNL
tara:strand:- start:8514 stop:9506 length:993 start_codon:yes stop_codon:yes gene_type:complete